MFINQIDIDLISSLESYAYEKSMKGIASDGEQEDFKDLKHRLKSLSNKFKDKYNSAAGPFISDVATGNPISYHGNLRRVWSGIFKGSENKQYSGQISFVINTQKQCLDVGFYFGRASSFNVKKEKRLKWETQLKDIGIFLFEQLKTDNLLKSTYDSLFNYGFRAEIKGERVNAEEWFNNLQIDPTFSSIVFNLKPNENRQIEFSDIDFYVSMVLPLISVLPENINQSDKARKLKSSLTPEQRAKQAEKRALIGLEGEKFILKAEKEKIAGYTNVTGGDYPIHKSIISDSFGYDILSKDENGKDIFIEVKTTTYMEGEPGSEVMYMSFDEFNFYKSNKEKYRLYRVYDIYGSPSYEVLEMSNLTRTTNNYRLEIPS